MKAFMLAVIKDFISIQQDELYEAKPSLGLESEFIQLFNQITCQCMLTFFYTCSIVVKGIFDFYQPALVI